MFNKYLVYAVYQNGGKSLRKSTGDRVAAFRHANQVVDGIYVTQSFVIDMNNGKPMQIFESK